MLFMRFVLNFYLKWDNLGLLRMLQNCRQNMNSFSTGYLGIIITSALLSRVTGSVVSLSISLSYSSSSFILVSDMFPSHSEYFTSKNGCITCVYVDTTSIVFAYGEHCCKSTSQALNDILSAPVQSATPIRLFSTQLL